MERILYKTEVLDPILNLPIYIFDTSFLPPTNVINYDEFLPTFLTKLPTTPYVLLLFSCGLNKISWVNGLKFIKLFISNNHNENLVKIITVHDSWFLKSFNSILLNYYSSIKLNKIIDIASSNIISLIDVYQNNTQKLITCDTLSTLSNYLDITKLKISLEVYKHDLQIKPLKLSMRFTPLINPLTKLNMHTNPLFYHHFYQLFNIIDFSCNKTPMVFHKPGNKTNTDILFNCIQRNQLFWINDWDFFCITSVFKRILTELAYPIIPVDLIKLPMNDDLPYVETVFSDLMKYHRAKQFNFDQLLYQLFTLFHKIIQSGTEHTPVTLAKSVSHCLSQQIVSSNNNNIIIVNRFIKNVIQNWHHLENSYSYPTVDEVINGKSNLEDLYYNHDITIDEIDDELTAFSKPNSQFSQFFDSNSSVSSDYSEGNSTRSISSSTQKGSLAEETKRVERMSLDTKVETRDLLVEDVNKQQPREPKESIEPKPKGSEDQVALKKAIEPKKKLTDISNISIQYPPQKYKVPTDCKRKPIAKEEPKPQTKKPVIRGRKVGELAKLFEERTQALEILKGM